MQLTGIGDAFLFLNNFILAPYDEKIKELDSLLVRKT